MTENITEAVADGRDISGETYLGMRVAAWREKSRHGEKYSHVYSEHWSTPGAWAKNVERLFTEHQVKELLAATARERDQMCRTLEDISLLIGAPNELVAGKRAQVLNEVRDLILAALTKEPSHGQ